MSSILKRAKMRWLDDRVQATLVRWSEEGTVVNRRHGHGCLGLIVPMRGDEYLPPVCCESKSPDKGVRIQNAAQVRGGFGPQ